MEKQRKTTLTNFEEVVRKMIALLAGSGVLFVGATEVIHAQFLSSSSDIFLATSLIMYAASETESNEVGSVCFILVSFLFKALIDAGVSPGTLPADIVGAAVASGYVASTVKQHEKRKRG